MAFSDETKDKAFKRSAGRCECHRPNHDHGARRCPRFISRDHSEYRHVTPESIGGSDGLDNCEVLCLSCRRMTGP